MGEKKGTGNPEDFQPTRRNLEYSGTIDQLISLFQIAGLLDVIICFGGLLQHVLQ